MPFDLTQFLLFFIAIYIPYLFLGHKWQNRLLLTASCLFYAAWDWRFVFLIFVSITTDYFCGLKIYESTNEKIKKRFLFLSIFVNLSLLGFFKYFNFFVKNFILMMNHFGFSACPNIVHILLPVGISFYTLKTISYVIDIYTGKTIPTRSYRDYALFVSFFPLILAGPIMRAEDLLRQISNKRKPGLDLFCEGTHLIFLGIFQKFVVADRLSGIADKVFNSQPPYNGIAVLFAVYAFAFQIYCDFAGYSNIARGLGKYMGFDIMVNFNLPYFATNPQDFWNRWHISLSRWLRDYLYTPIAIFFRRYGSWGIVFSLMITFLLCGLWHGASWNFIVWGAYWGALLILYRFLKPVLIKIPSPENNILQIVWFGIRAILFFHIICFGWIVFRPEISMDNAWGMVKSIFYNFHHTDKIGMSMIPLLFSILVIESIQYWKKDLMSVYKISTVLKVCLYIVFFYLFLLSGANGEKEFLYFQF